MGVHQASPSPSGGPRAAEVEGHVPLGIGAAWAKMAMMTPDAETRRKLGGTWETRVTARDDPDEDALFWLRIPADERARETWELSWELHLLASRNGGVLDEDRGALLEGDIGEPRLPRSAYRVERR
jgi:hypothetical protein